MEASIYEEMKGAEVPIDNHESDLYVLKTAESKRILEAWDYHHIITIFRNKVDGQIWYDIPFAYKPFWDSKLNKKGE